MKTVLTVLYGEDYACYSDVLTFLFIAGGIRYVSLMLDKAIIATRHFVLRLNIWTLGAFIMIASCYYLVPRKGLIGGATASIIGSIAVLTYGSLSNYWVVRRLFCRSGVDLRDME